MTTVYFKTDFLKILLSQFLFKSPSVNQILWRLFIATVINYNTLVTLCSLLQSKLTFLECNWRLWFFTANTFFNGKLNEYNNWNFQNFQNFNCFHDMWTILFTTFSNEYSHTLSLYYLILLCYRCLCYLYVTSFIYMLPHMSLMP